MFTRARGVKNLPGMHCDHVLQDKTRQTSTKNRACFFPFLFQHNNGQQEAIDWNIDLWSRLRWFYFKSARFVAFVVFLGSAAMQMYGDLYVAQKGCLSALHFWAYTLQVVNILLFPKWNQHPCSHASKWNTHSNLFWPEIEVFNLRAAWNEDFARF